MHGDIKPGNLLLDSAANAWVTDFGLSRNQSEPLEASSGLVGTLRYLARNNSRDADVRTDIYCARRHALRAVHADGSVWPGRPVVLIDPQRRPELPRARR